MHVLSFFVALTILLVSLMKAVQQQI